MGRYTYPVVIFIYIVSSCLCVEHLLLPHYPFDLDSAGQAIEGFVDSKVEDGSKVRVTEIEGKKFIENGMEVGYLQLVVRKGKNQLNGTEQYIAVDTEAFIVDKDGYIIVNTTETFDHNKAIEFYVVMFRDGDIVSNPVPFVVRAEKHIVEENYEYNETAAVFAGVLICLIVIFALLIPFVVRAKRRSKHGKPIFKLGSHPSALDKVMAQEKGSQATLTTHMVENQTGNQFGHRIMTEGDFYDNRGFRLEEEVEREKNELTRDLLAIASHVPELDEATNVIKINKSDNSDSDSGMSSDTRNDRSKRKTTSILKNGHDQQVYTIEMNRTETTDNNKTSTDKQTSRL